MPAVCAGRFTFFGLGLSLIGGGEAEVDASGGRRSGRSSSSGLRRRFADHGADMAY